MGILLWILFGALAGWLASLAMGTDAQQGSLANIIIGIVGSMIGGFVMSFFGGPGVSGFNLTCLLVAVLGSVILIWIVKRLR